MFGPGATVESKLKILLIPVRNEIDELQTAKEFLDGTTIKVMRSAKDHDNAIGIVLGLTYFSNLAFSDSASSFDEKSLAEVAGTTFRMQSILAESILTDEPELISVLIMDNPHARKHIKQFLARADKLARLASLDSPARFEGEIRRVIARKAQRSNLQRSYERLYSAMQAVDK
jgi:prephenate dehydrogenase